VTKGRENSFALGAAVPRRGTSGRSFFYFLGEEEGSALTGLHLTKSVICVLEGRGKRGRGGISFEMARAFKVNWS